MAGGVYKRRFSTSGERTATVLSLDIPLLRVCPVKRVSSRATVIDGERSVDTRRGGRARHRGAVRRLP
ncbi:hypothetical protein BN903_42 [Halorubrum sp. AJ67]|nr:hypothetical protein BN903_42 [Halorubrum sp. AJ67]